MSDYKVWTEKYRPKTFDFLIGNEIIVQKIKQNTAMKNITNLLLHGPSGNGKTTCAYIVARSILGKNNLHGAFLEINASDQNNRGIDVVTQKIKPFVRTLPLLPGMPFKILLLDEADSLSKDMMRSLRRTMEKYNHNCRFILTANNVEAIIPAIRSRCTEYDFKPVGKDAMIDHLRYISMKEELQFTDKQFEQIAKKADFDMRKGINILQTMQVDTSDYSGVFGR